MHLEQQQQVAALELQLQAATAGVNKLQEDLASAQVLTIQAQNVAELITASNLCYGQENGQLHKQVDQLATMLSDPQQQQQQQNLGFKQRCSNRKHQQLLSNRRL